MAEALQTGHHKLDQQCDADGHFSFLLDVFPVGQKKACAEEEIKGDTEITKGHMDAVRVVALRGHGIMDGEQHVSQLRNHQIDSGYQVQPPGLAGLLLHQNGNVLIKQEKHNNHRSDKETMKDVIQQNRHRFQVIHRIDGDPVQNQMEQHDHQKHRKRLM